MKFLSASKHDHDCEAIVMILNGLYMTEEGLKIIRLLEQVSKKITINNNNNFRGKASYRINYYEERLFCLFGIMCTDESSTIRPEIC